MKARRIVTSVRTTQSSPTSATTTIPRAAQSIAESAARSMSAGPRAVRAGAPASTPTAAADRPSLTAFTGAASRRRSSAADLLHHGVDEVGPDDVAELLVDAVRRLAIRGPVNLVDGETLLLEEFRRLLGLLGHGLAPVPGELMRGRAQIFLQVRGQRIELALAHHHDAGVVDVVGEVDDLDDLVMLGGRQRDDRRLDRLDRVLGEREIDLAVVDRDGVGAECAEHAGEDRARLHPDLQPFHVLGLR